MKNLTIDFTKGAEEVTVDEAIALHENLNIAVRVNDGHRIVFQYEGSEARGSASHN
jgi:hypothetical protein